MIPYNVLAAVDLPFMPLSKLRKRKQVLPFWNNVMPAEEDNANRMRRAIWNLVILPNLRSAFIFTQESDRVEWTIFESKRKPVSKLEARGMFVLAMQELKDEREGLKKITIPKSECNIPHKPVIQFLQSLEANKPFFVIFTFQNFLFATGTFYNESLMCEALINFSPSKSEQVINITNRNRDGLSFYQQKRKPSFSIEVPELYEMEENLL